MEFLGESAQAEVLSALLNIADASLSWDEFVDKHGSRVILAGHDTYPGADPLYWFAVVGASGAIYQIAGKGPYGQVIVCSAVLR
ncbi:hypothetical protein KY495_21075 [Massilia sp. PAMC28688]|uniref:hypothetical protein n=1 Tax=Massilia sp. PAMC28688 TaxID=2861283 RepID=UPI001C62A015|nr:hypothetical protein [Massilia sp. PAMC28688]QYF93154.1 hypothetical protein KY495_21075 [Massilia sp. PAMC28688]